MKKFTILVALTLAMTLASAYCATCAPTVLGNTSTGLMGAMNSLCESLKSLLPVAGMLMIMVAGLIYAAGQIMGAETRARANVWATAALTGALIAILIAVIAPPVLKAIYGADWGSGFCGQ